MLYVGGSTAAAAPASTGGGSKGAYSGTTAYVTNDLVTYNGSAYIALGSTTGNLPTNTTYWAPFGGSTVAAWSFTADQKMGTD